jgi:hypothetical protein
LCAPEDEGGALKRVSMRCRWVLRMAIVLGSSLSVSHTRGQPPAGERLPGEHARAVVLRLRMRTLLTLGVLAIMTGALGRLFGLRSVWFVGSELALLASMFSVSRWVLPLLDRRDRGASAEEQVGRMLDGLQGGWRVLHDARFSHGNVDHIVLGRRGLFAIETKSHPGPVRLQRSHGATLAQARGHAEVLEQISGERVEPLLVYSRAWVDRPLARRRGVRVLPARMLASYLERHTPAFTQECLERVHAQVANAVLGEPRRRRRRGLGRLRWWPPLSLRPR